MSPVQGLILEREGERDDEMSQETLPYILQSIASICDLPGDALSPSQRDERTVDDFLADAR